MYWLPHASEECRDISKPLPTNLGDVTHCVLAEVVAQLKQVGKMQEDVEGLKQAQAHTAQGLTYLATVRHHPCTLCLLILTHSPYKSCLVTDWSVYCDKRTVTREYSALLQCLVLISFSDQAKT